jgi:predicted dehydrogenase
MHLYHIYSHNTMERIGAAIIGVGRIGQVHLKNMIEGHNIEVYWMVDNLSFHSKLKQLTEMYNIQDTRITSPDDIHTVLTDKRYYYAFCIFFCNISTFNASRI